MAAKLPVGRFSWDKFKVINSLDFCVKDKLGAQEYTNIVNFLDSLNFYCIEQHPDWNVKIEDYSHTFFLCTDDNGKVICFANIILTNGPFKTANINFGPAFSDFGVLKEAIQFLHNYFLSQKFIFFSIQLGINISNQTELLEYNINKDFKIKYYFKSGNLWSSICVDLTRPETEILQSFSKGHKSTIKSAYSKSKLRISMQNNPDNLESFIDLYVKMMEFRKLPYNKENIIHLFNSINGFIYENNKGFIGYIFDGHNLVGGTVILYQGNSARYYKGTSDPERRDIPILHFGLFEAMKFCKINGCVTFDLWGYNHFVDEKDQIFFINKFKKGFSGDFTFFPKRMNFVLNPIFYSIFVSLKTSKNKIMNLKRNIFKSKKLNSEKID